MRALTIVLAALSVAGVGAQTQVRWHINRFIAFRAARESHKPVMLYLYLLGHEGCQKLEQVALISKEVVRAARHLECGLVNAETDDEFARQVLTPEFLREQLGTDPERGDLSTRLKTREFFSGIAPVLFFFTADGRELYRFRGVPDGAELAAKMRLVVRMAEALRRDPEEQDAVAQAQVGHIYVELEIAEAAEPYLMRARKLDADNQLGARENAELDLAITLLQREKLDFAIEMLMTFLAEYPGSERLCEARFQLAIAVFGSGDEQRAEQMLRELGDVPPGTARDKVCAETEWGRQARAIIFRLDRNRGVVPEREDDKPERRPERDRGRRGGRPRE